MRQGEIPLIRRKESTTEFLILPSVKFRYIFTDSTKVAICERSIGWVGLVVPP